MSPQITSQQIIADRAARKASGLVGCMTGRPEPELDFFGFRDVQMWNMDSQGRMPGHEGFNRRDPFCFCFDHRSAFDPTGETDASLVNEGHAMARYTYRSLFPNEVIPDPHAPRPSALVIPDPPNLDDDDDDDDDDDGGIPPPGGDMGSSLLSNATNPPTLWNPDAPPSSRSNINLTPLYLALPLPENDDEAETEIIPPAQELVEPADEDSDNTLEQMAYQDQYCDCCDDHDDRQDEYDSGGGGCDWNESGYFD